MMSHYDLPVLKKQYERALASDAASQKEHVRKKYTRPSAWAGRKEEENCRLSGITVPSTLGSLLRGGQENDATNAHLLHQALRLTPTQAEDANLWARLAHVELWGYMQQRWRPGDDLDMKKVSLFVQRRYFVAQRNSRHLMRHGVARLWWAAELTHDNGSYRDIETLLWMPEVAERQYGQYPRILKTLLRFISSKRAALEKKGTKANLRKIYFRPLLKSLNQHGAHTQLGQLDPEEIETFLQKAFWRIQVAVRGAKKAKKSRRTKA